VPRKARRLEGWQSVLPILRGSLRSHLRIDGSYHAQSRPKSVSLCCCADRIEKPCSSSAFFADA
jgi:hypothetical protein